MCPLPPFLSFPQPSKLHSLAGSGSWASPVYGTLLIYFANEQCCNSKGALVYKRLTYNFNTYSCPMCRYFNSNCTPLHL